MKKKLMSALLAVVMIVSLLSACGGKTEQPQATVADAGVSTTVEANENYFSEPVKITWMTWNVSNTPVFYDMLTAKAKEYYNIDLEVQNYSSDEYTNILLTKAAANDVPDICEVHKITTGEGAALLEQGLLADISDYAVKDRVTSACYTVQDDGGIYFYTHCSGTVGLYYNKTVFEEYGIKVPDNIEELYAACETLKANNVTPLAAGFKEPWSATVTVWSLPHQFVVGDKTAEMNKIWEEFGNGTRKFAEDEGAIKVFDFAFELRDRGYFQQHYMGTDSTQAASMLAYGDAGMFISGAWMYPQIMAINPDAEIGFIAIPANEPGQPRYIGNDAAQGPVVAKDCENMKAAELVYELYFSPELMTQWFTESKAVPLIEGVTVDDPFTKMMMEAFENSAGYGSDYWQAAWPASVDNDYKLLYQEALSNPEITAEEFAQQMDELIENALKNEAAAN